MRASAVKHDALATALGYLTWGKKRWGVSVAAVAYALHSKASSQIGTTGATASNSTRLGVPTSQTPWSLKSLRYRRHWFSASNGHQADSAIREDAARSLLARSAAYKL